MKWLFVVIWTSELNVYFVAFDWSVNRLLSSLASNARLQLICFFACQRGQAIDRAMVLPPYNTVAWGLLKGYPWWPVYVFDPKKLRPDLYHLGNPSFPTPMFVVRSYPASTLGSAHAQILKRAQEEPQKWRIDYLSTAATQRTLPYIIPSDLDPKLSPPRPDIIDLVDSDDEGVQPAGHPSSLASPAPPRPMRDDTVSNVPYNSLAWVRPQGFPWWPVYVCDPTELRDDLHHLGTCDEVLSMTCMLKLITGVGRNHVTLLMRARNEPNDHRLVYYFGRYVLYVYSVLFACFQPGRPMMPPTIPYLEPSDLHKSLPAPPPLVVPFLSLGWTSKEGYTWLPVYVLDPYTVNPVLHHLGNKHAKGLHEVLSNPDNLRLVYIFGCHEIESRPNDAVKPWQGPEHAAFVKGFPKAVKKPIALDMLTQALNEAKVCQKFDYEHAIMNNHSPTPRTSTAPTKRRDDCRL
ncbi:hypothetical protein DYB34_012235 [Aphanomyces astaci]|uniref:PWWP domain-containing protein n=1 Tax=Aphanomyces astaci TaxID=112090 RepID=A0A3R6ZHM3_APHAT|nr:hypothetical protein DYB34_012235 [Aphanomyces astaci]